VKTRERILFLCQKEHVPKYVKEGKTTAPFTISQL
jgi:hypothetical protein